MWSGQGCNVKPLSALWAGGHCLVKVGCYGESALMGDSKSDLEVIVDFLEECQICLCCIFIDLFFTYLIVYCSAWPLPSYMCPAELMGTLPGSLPNSGSTTAQSSQNKCQARATGSGKRVRLFHFLFELLEDPTMAHCVSWVPSAIGVFRFSSTNKDQVAAMWGQRKGNKRLMTYQKMSRALRNYARTGEILKVKKKLTYQFGLDTLLLLQKRRHGSF
ncbi:hypothetical protein WMY93_025728 [Mugilogobius chulae]|uniref:Transcription factor Spi-C n=1 Tax=Mugilogobius chulae TaxID=88201 RepID=A0AAW0N7U6_9GOBI